MKLNAKILKISEEEMNVEMMNEKIEAILAELTLDEKLGMIHGAEFFQTLGVSRLNIPPVKSSDGPMGVRSEFYPDQWVASGHNDDFVTYGISNSALANTWNRELAYGTGQVLGEEARGRGKDIILAPGVNIKRNPGCGRNFEYFSEDPYLTAELCVPMIQGIQESDVAACVKHFALNSQETERLWVNVEIDEKALREIYLPAFYAACKKGKAYSVMGAYNLLRGEHCCQNKFLLGDILRGEWQYDGMVVSDWGGVHDTKLSAESSLDMEMGVTPDFDEYMLANPLKKAIESGEIEESCVDEKVRNILRMMLRLKMIDAAVSMSSDGKKEVKVTTNAGRKRGAFNTPQHRQAVLDAARESIVLLKNEDKRLPLDLEKQSKVLVIGDNASKLQSLGGGSAEIKALYETTPLMGIKELLGGNREVVYARGYFVPTEDESDVNWQETSTGDDSTQWTASKKRPLTETELEEQKKLREEAVALATECDEVIIVGGLNHDYDVEGADRDSLELPYGQDQLIEEVLKVNPDAVVVMFAGSPVNMESWSDKAKAIVWMSYSGMEGGKALAEILFGEVNPSGKLSETLPCKLAESNAYALADGLGRTLTEEEKAGYAEHLMPHLTASYTDGMLVGYRYYERKNVPVQFVFGHGLSYTGFSYTNPEIRVKNEKVNEAVIMAEVTVTVTNTGAMEGKEVVQIYVGNKAADETEPVSELKGFEKVSLKPGESKEVRIPLCEEAFTHYNEQTKAWEVVKGDYIIRVAASLTDVKALLEIRV